MAHCFIMDFDGATAAQYDAVIEDMELGGRLPAHALYHGAGSPDGRSWRVVDVWETPEDFERFAAEPDPVDPGGHGGGSCLRATSIPACQPGARPAAGGRIDSASIPLLAITHAITEFEFHISPVPSSSRPHTGVGTCATTSSTRRARCSSLVSRRGLSTASAASGMCAFRHRRIS